MLQSADIILKGIKFGEVNAEVYIAMIMNRAILVDRARQTLSILEKLPIDDDYNDPRLNEWLQGVKLAGQDVDAMTSGEAWREYSVAAREASDELVSSGLSFTVSIVAASGLKVGGIALGAAAKVVQPYLLALPLLLEGDQHFEDLTFSTLAAQVFAELYRKGALGDHLETQSYTKYLAYSYFYDELDNWVVTFASYFRGGRESIEKTKGTYCKVT